MGHIDTPIDRHTDTPMYQIFEYRFTFFLIRVGGSAPHINKISWNIKEYRGIAQSWSVLEARWIYENIIAYWGILWNSVAYQSLGTVTAHTGISWNVEQFNGITWNTMVSWSVCLGSSLIMLEHHGTSRNPMNNYDVSWSALEVSE